MGKEDPKEAPKGVRAQLHSYGIVLLMLAESKSFHFSFSMRKEKLLERIVTMGSHQDEIKRVASFYATTPDERGPGARVRPAPVVKKA